MTLLEMKKEVLRLIEEISPNNPALTDDPDIAEKINTVVNLIMFEMARFKKMPAYVDIEVKKGDILSLEDIGNKAGYEVFQLDVVKGVDFEFRANGTIVKALEDGVLEVDFFKYPERITEKTKDNYEFELSQDALAIMPYGIAADLLKSDVSANYGNIYAERYEALKQTLDSRSVMPSIAYKGGYDI